MFDETFLKSIGGQDNRDFGGDVFSYTHPTDTIAEILGDDYFTLGFQNFNTDDRIQVINSLGVIPLRVTGSGEDGVTMAAGGPQGLEAFASLAIAGAIPLTAETVLLTTSATTAWQLFAGFPGQILNLYMEAQSTGSGTITTQTGATGFINTIVFSAKGDACVIKFIDDGSTVGWIPLSNNSVVFALT